MAHATSRSDSRKATVGAWDRVPPGQPSIAMYFRAADGVVYRVHDATLANARYHSVAVGTLGATHRVFVREDGRRRTFQFKRGDNHDIIAALLEHQLKAAR